MVKMKKFINFNGRRYYSENFKKHIVQEVEKGLISKEAAKHKYGISGNSAILNWCRKYGKNHKYSGAEKAMGVDKISKAAYKKRIKELEKELSETKLKASYLECLIEVSEEMGINISKKPEIQPSKEAKNKTQKEV